MKSIQKIIALTLLTLLSWGCEDSVNSDTENNFDNLIGFWDINSVDVELYEKESGEELSIYLSNNFNISDNEINDIFSTYVEGNEREYSGIRFHFRVDNIYTYNDDSGYYAEGLWKVNKENSTLSLAPYDEYNNSSDVTLDIEKITSESLIITAPENFRKVIENDTVFADATLFLNFIKTEPF